MTNIELFSDRVTGVTNFSKMVPMFCWKVKGHLLNDYYMAGTLGCFSICIHYLIYSIHKAYDGSIITYI